jgi:hypothetical protein
MFGCYASVDFKNNIDAICIYKDIVIKERKSTLRANLSITKSRLNIKRSEVEFKGFIKLTMIWLIF